MQKPEEKPSKDAQYMCMIMAQNEMDKKMCS